MGGDVGTGGALTYATDWMEFFITDALGGTATVDELADGFTGEMYEISTSAGGAPIAGGGPLLATNTPTFITLSTGVDYFLGLSAAAPLSGFGSSDFSVQVADRREHSASRNTCALCRRARAAGLRWFAQKQKVSAFLGIFRWGLIARGIFDLRRKASHPWMWGFSAVGTA